LPVEVDPPPIAVCVLPRNGKLLSECRRAKDFVGCSGTLAHVHFAVDSHDSPALGWNFAAAHNGYVFAAGSLNKGGEYPSCLTVVLYSPPFPVLALAGDVIFLTIGGRPDDSEVRARAVSHIHIPVDSNEGPFLHHLRLACGDHGHVLDIDRSYIRRENPPELALQVDLPPTAIGVFASDGKLLSQRCSTDDRVFSPRTGPHVHVSVNRNLPPDDYLSRGRRRLGGRGRFRRCGLGCGCSRQCYGCCCLCWRLGCRRRRCGFGYRRGSRQDSGFLDFIPAASAQCKGQKQEKERGCSYA